MYKKFTSIDRSIEGDLCRMACAWHGVAINQSMAVGNSVSKTHIDWQDCVSGFNAVIPWKNFGGGNLILWPAKVIYQVEPGECFFVEGLWHTRCSLLRVEFVTHWTCFVTRVPLIGTSAILKLLVFRILDLKLIYNK